MASNQLLSAFRLAYSPGDQALYYATPVNRLSALLCLLDVLRKLLEEGIGRDSLPPAGMIMGVVAEVPKSVHKSALDVRDCRSLGDQTRVLIDTSELRSPRQIRTFALAPAGEQDGLVCGLESLRRPVKLGVEVDRVQRAGRGEG